MGELAFLEGFFDDHVQPKILTSKVFPLLKITVFIFYNVPFSGRSSVNTCEFHVLVMILRRSCDLLNLQLCT